MNVRRINERPSLLFLQDAGELNTGARVVRSWDREQMTRALERAKVVRFLVPIRTTRVIAAFGLLGNYFFRSDKRPVFDLGQIQDRRARTIVDAESTFSRMQQASKG